MYKKRTLHITYHFCNLDIPKPLLSSIILLLYRIESLGMCQMKDALLYHLYHFVSF